MSPVCVRARSEETHRAEAMKIVQNVRHRDGEERQYAASEGISCSRANQGSARFPAQLRKRSGVDVRSDQSSLDQWASRAYRVARSSASW